MKCPYCGHADTQVKDSRPSEDNGAIRRRRYCPECSSRFTTFERVQLRELMVLKKTGDRKIFDREKVLGSIRIACRKRPVNEEEIEQIVSRIVQKLESSSEAEIKSSYIGELIMEELKAVDTVAYIRFASVYRDFAEAKDFQAIANQLGTRGE